MAAFAKQQLCLNAKGMNLEETLFCGQSFSWQRSEAGSYVGVAGGYAVRATAQQGNILLLRLAPGEMGRGERLFWENYFSLDTPYKQLLKAFCSHSALAACVQHAPGIRVLRQPFFDTLLSFIISQNNHIPRITGIVQRLCAGFGPALAPGVHGFPSPQALAGQSLAQLQPLRAGFRAKYLLDAAQQLCAGSVEESQLRALPSDEARKMLMKIKGVGPKVADCVLLFALGRTEVAPMDVWMRRAMQAAFPQGMPACAAGNEGIAQQYIFAWARQNLVGKG